MNLEAIKNWFIGNFLWAIFYAVVVFVFCKYLPSFMQAIKVSKRILKNNRDTRNNGLGKYSADRFFNIWYSSEKLPLRCGGKEFYPLKFGLNSRHWLSVIDQELKVLKLIAFFDTNRGYKAMKPIKNLRNKLVAKMTKFYLIHFIGDNPQYYKDLEKQSKK